MRRQWRPADPPPTTDPWHLLLVRREYVATRAAMAPKRPSPGACEQHTPPQRSVRSRVTPTSHSRRETPNLRHIHPDSPEWTDPRTTCLSLGLDPSDTIHAGVICNKCLFFWERKLRGDVANLANKERSGRRMTCERPFDCSLLKKIQNTNTRSRFGIS